ncbi:uncharacterized protein LOC119320015 [Triticum dicoccoides]|uniref:uncharacterized protein LOC119320015 n=1 Tax=Triticum dicoccoides TaxID=85692 RepID=UPI0018905310|nr:uncharacterized protein LOC119320015 [Triticum dicoccoides]
MLHIEVPSYNMRKHALALFLLLLTFASHGAWCAAAARSAMAEDAARHHLRPHHHGKRLLEIQTPRKVGHATGGSGGGSSGAGRSGGGGTDTRPHNSKNGGAMALPAPATSLLALVLTATILLSAHSF